MLLRFVVYNKFKQRRWSRLSYIQRLIVCQNIEKIEAKKQKRLEYQVAVKDMDNEGYAGLCRDRERQILIDDDYIKDASKRFLLMYTLFHECRHAYQHKRVYEKEKHSIFSKEYRWKINKEGYSNYSKNNKVRSYYTMQPVELDSNEYALKRLKSFRFRFRREKDYFRALEYYENRVIEREKQVKKELGIFYKLKVAIKNRKERKKRIKNNYESKKSTKNSK